MAKHVWKAIASLGGGRASVKHDESFFRFTRARFVGDEAEQIAQRQIKFNVDELCRVAGSSVG